MCVICDLFTGFQRDATLLNTPMSESDKTQLYYEYTFRFRGKKGEFREEFELQKFPFDEQHMTITLQVLKSASSIILESNEEYASVFVQSNFQSNNIFSVVHRDLVMTNSISSRREESASGECYLLFVVV